MAPESPQPWARGAWALARQQHGVVTRAQLVELGLGAEAIRRRLANGRLHRLMRGVYAVGRPEVSVRGRWMAATLACGPQALLSHRGAAMLWGLRPVPGGASENDWAGHGQVDVVVPAGLPKKRPGIRVHRRRDHEAPGRRVVDGIPVTHPVATLVDLATCLPTGQLEAAINEADHLDLVDPERLLDALDSLPRWAGVAQLRALLAGPTVALTSTELERRFLPLAHAAGLRAPQTRRSGSTVTGSTSTGPSWTWWSRRTASGITARPSSKRGTSGATTPTPAPVAPASASAMGRSATNLSTCGGRSRGLPRASRRVEEGTKTRPVMTLVACRARSLRAQKLVAPPSRPLPAWLPRGPVSPGRKANLALALGRAPGVRDARSRKVRH